MLSDMERQIEACGVVEENCETFERCDRDKSIEVENKVDCGNQSMMSILKAKLLKVKRVLANLILVSTTDPGIIPRNDQEYSEGAGNGDGTKSKKRNHRFYMALVIFALIFYVYIFAFSCWRLHQRIWKDEDGFLGMVKTCPETLALAAFGLTAIGFLGPLTIYHAYLIAVNETTYENFRQRYVGSRSPYDRGILRNFKEAFLVALPPPRVDFRAEVTGTKGPE
ncbi:Palmitoyltransferase, DHHC domain [Sesbania bispinosa]|nr:Palmitoyltransferase, DHHC domain [Sesbania bispinosa]